MPIQYQPSDYFPEPGSAATIFKRLRVGPVLPHFHAFDELVFILTGNGQHIVNGVAFDFQAGDIFVVPSGAHHHYRHVQCMSIVCVLLRPDRLTGQTSCNAYDACSSLKRGIPRHIRPAKHLFAAILKYIVRIEHEKSPDCEKELAMLLHTIASADAASMHHSSTMAYQSDRAQELILGLQHLESNFADPDPLPPLCDLVHMSQRTLLRRFHEVTGRSPICYLSDLRMHHAMLELKRGRRSVLDLAMDCGFNDLSYFHRRFHKATGLTPNVWRKKPAYVW